MRMEAEAESVPACTHMGMSAIHKWKKINKQSISTERVHAKSKSKSDLKRDDKVNWPAGRKPRAELMEILSVSSPSCSSPRLRHVWLAGCKEEGKWRRKNEPTRRRWKCNLVPRGREVWAATRLPNAAARCPSLLRTAGVLERSRWEGRRSADVRRRRGIECEFLIGTALKSSVVTRHPGSVT